MKPKYTIVVLAIAGMLITNEAAIAQKSSTIKSTCCDLKSDMRKLWEDHITWTRNVIFNILDTLPGTTEAVNRLLQNQVDIGNAIKPYYGEAAGNQLTALLHDHITIAAELLTALRDNNTTAFNDANAMWYANANAIAEFLGAANPRHWPVAEMKTMMKEHLDATAVEALARKNKDYAADVIAYDNVHNQILQMADMLTEGIIAQFPNMFKGCAGGKNQSTETSITGVKLNQNSPNPFSDNTIISYFVPETIKQAQIMVYDAMGNKLMRFDIREKGEGSVTFNASYLKKGIYMYSIVADGKLIDTKKMIH
jgi:hypothetical protein